MSRLASWLIRGLRRLIRWRWVGEGTVLDLHRAGRPYVHAFFHDQLLMMTYSYLGQDHGRRLAVLSSRHRDGEYVARTLERFGHLMVRGSTGPGHGGASGLKEMIRRLREGQDAAFAVDGPRGPRHVVQIGVVEAARLGGAPLVPVALGLSKKKTLRSWDRFQVPLPFSRGVFAYGEPILVPADAGRELMERKRAELESALLELTARAEGLAAGGVSGTPIRRPGVDDGVPCPPGGRAPATPDSGVGTGSRESGRKGARGAGKGQDAGP